MSETILIKQAAILPMTSNEPECFTGDILIKDRLIRQVAPEIRAAGTEQVIEARGMAALPGLVNCHNHAAMALFRGYSDDLRLMEWLKDRIWPAEAKLSSEDVYWGTMLACAEMLKSGTTAFADMYLKTHDVARAVADAGIRAAICEGLVANGREEKWRLETEELFNKWHGFDHGRITAMVGAHAPFTCPPEHMEQTMELAEKLNVPVHIHLSETVEEVDQMFSTYGKSPVKYLDDLGLFARHHVLLAHCVNLSRDDIHLLTKLNGGISHNPVSNQKLGCGVAPVCELLKQNINVALGTDGPGSVTTLDMFEEIKAAAWLQKNKTGDPTALDAYQVLRMATVNGAKALGIDDLVGTIAEGKVADIILVDLEKPHLYPQNDLFALLAYAANGSDVDTVIVNGKIVVRERKLLTFSEKEAMQKCQEIAKRILY